MNRRWDIAVIGAGMAGASLAARLAGRASVVLLEAESAPGYHATGRSAAFWTESYGGPGVQPLTSASGAELRRIGVLRSRGALTIAHGADAERVEDFVRRFAELGVRIEAVGRQALEAAIPGLRPGWILGAWEPDCCDIDVAALHAHYLGMARKAGADLLCSAEVRAIEPGRTLRLADGRSVAADIVVNAAGAWADGIAALAGARPLGITPYRRTVAQLRTVPAVPADLPLVLDLRERFYFKPESGRLWLSPHDETPSPPCDAAAEEIDVARAIERFGEVTDWTVERVEHRWAGLRSFAPDRLPVYGFDPEVSGFFWFAGQGGFGIQTAPAGAELAARLLLGDAGGAIDPARYSPRRLA
jgi:D-arginine dehydrogenase